jgi:hypothetical protein
MVSYMFLLGWTIIREKEITGKNMHGNKNI